MSGPVVCDASAVVALLLDSGADGEWAVEQVSGGLFCAPSLLKFECSNVVRRLEASGVVSPDQAAQAHSDLLDLEVEEWPHELVGRRVWELRANLSSYDAGYVAVAEMVSAPLVTLDRRISRAPGLRCQVIVP